MTKNLRALVARGKTIAVPGATGALGEGILSLEQLASHAKTLADGRLAADTRPLEDFLGYKDAPGRSR